MEKQVARRVTSTGRCNLCGRTFARGGLTRHLQFGWASRNALAEAPKGYKGREGKVFLVVVGDRCSSDYWMHIEVPAAVKLVDLDRFLRATWLECCGHMSAFEIGGETYYSGGARELGGGA